MRFALPLFELSTQESTTDEGDFEISLGQDSNENKLTVPGDLIDSAQDQGDSQSQPGENPDVTGRLGDFQSKIEGEATVIEQPKPIAKEQAGNGSWNWLWLIPLLLICWLLYRMRTNSRRSRTRFESLSQPTFPNNLGDEKTIRLNEEDSRNEQARNEAKIDSNDPIDVVATRRSESQAESAVEGDGPQVQSKPTRYEWASNESRLTPQARQTSASVDADERQQKIVFLENSVEQARLELNSLHQEKEKWTLEREGFEAVQSDLKRRLNELSNHSDLSEASKLRLGEMEDQITTLRAECKDLETLNEKLIEELEESKLESSSDTSSHELNELHKKIEGTKVIHEELIAENTRLTQKVEELEGKSGDSPDLIARVSELEEQLEKAKANESEFSGRLEGMTTALAANESKLANFDQQAFQIGQLTNEKEAAERQLAELQSRTDQFESSVTELTKERDDAVSRFNESEEARTYLAGEMAVALEKLEKTSAAEQEIKKLEDEVERLNVANRELHQSVNEKNAESEELKSRFNSTVEELDRIQQQVSALPTAADIAKVKNALDEKSAEVEELNDILHKKDEDYDLVSNEKINLQREMQELNSKLESGTRMFDQTTTGLENAQRELAAMREAAETTRDEFVAMKSRYEQLEASLQQEKENAAAHHAEVERLTAAVAGHEKSKDELLAAFQKEKQQLAGLAAQIQATEKSHLEILQKHEHGMSELTQEKTKLESELGVLGQALTDEKTKVEQLAAEYTEQQGLVDQLQATNVELKKVAELHAQEQSQSHVKLEAELEKFKNRDSELRVAMQAHLERIATLEEANRKAFSDVEDLRIENIRKNNLLAETKANVKRLSESSSFGINRDGELEELKRLHALEIKNLKEQISQFDSQLQSTQQSYENQILKFRQDGEADDSIDELNNLRERIEAYEARAKEHDARWSSLVNESKSFRTAKRDFAKVTDKVDALQQKLDAKTSELKLVVKSNRQNEKDLKAARRALESAQKAAGQKKVAASRMAASASKSVTRKSKPSTKTPGRTAPKRSTTSKRTTKPVGKTGTAAKHVTKPDNLKRIEGIGPKVEKLLKESGITTFALLAKSSRKRLTEILDKAGSRYRIINPETWAAQSKLAAKGNWDELKKLQDNLDGGRIKRKKSASKQ